jgi:SOS-response transcriptional repressor LexA|tara:strand:- start:350 stop:598 length:249 start_codon:yes stop_codon:yes gene_type:complete
MARNYKWISKDMLTPRQLQMFNFLKEYKKQNQYMPTHREIQKYMNMKSISQVNNMLGYLDWKKYIKKHTNMNRGIEILKEIA